jgi:hypothetical protein
MFQFIINMYIFDTAETFTQSLSPPEYDPVQNEENGAYLAVPADAVKEQPITYE